MLQRHKETKTKTIYKNVHAKENDNKNFYSKLKSKN